MGISGVIKGVLGAQGNSTMGRAMLQRKERPEKCVAENFQAITYTFFLNLKNLEAFSVCSSNRYHKVKYDAGRPGLRSK
jgi:hypothetical protein